MSGIMKLLRFRFGLLLLLPLPLRDEEECGVRGGAEGWEGGNVTVLRSRAGDDGACEPRGSAEVFPCDRDEPHGSINNGTINNTSGNIRNYVYIYIE